MRLLLFSLDSLYCSVYYGSVPGSMIILLVNLLLQCHISFELFKYLVEEHTIRGHLRAVLVEHRA